jgi:catechol 2,3-dioxygenase
MSQATPAIRTAALHHVTLKTTRAVEMCDWYSNLLGAQTKVVAPPAVFMSYDGANHRFGFLQVPGLEDDPDRRSHTGVHHTAFEYESIDDLLLTYKRLRDAGEPPISCFDHGATTSFYWTDPDDNVVELMVDNFGDWAKSTEFATGPVFRADPVGVVVDPELMLAAFEAEGDLAGHHQRAYYGREFDAAEPGDLQLPIAVQS